jgi:predicted chitinase/uncharacterized protein YraI
MIVLTLLLAALYVSAQADARAGILEWAKWGEAHKNQFHYRQVRPIQYSSNLPWIGDCSGFVTFCYKQAGAPDPNGMNYNGAGYTGTLVSHGRQISQGELIPGDVVIYGPGTGEHAAVIMEGGSDPMTISMGQEGDPHWVRVSWDGRFHRYFRYDTSIRFASHSPGGGSAPPPPAPHPAPAPAPNGGPAKCLTTSVNIRSGPGTGHGIVATGQVGEVFVVSGGGTADNGYNWFHVTRCGGGTSGYMAIRPDWQRDCSCGSAPAPAPPRAAPAPAPKPASRPAPAPAPRAAPAPAPSQAKCLTTSVNLRSGPGTGHGIVATGQAGEVFVVSGGGTAANGYNWFHVTRCGGGTSGYMAIRPDWQNECHCDTGAAHPPVHQTPPNPQPQPKPQPASPSTASEVEKWKQVIRAMTPNAASWIVDGVAATMPEMVTKFALNTENRQAFFLAQTAEESAGYITTTEFASGAEYNGRADLGNTHPGDGPRYKGRGIIQLTGRSNYAHYGQILGVNFEGNPDIAAKFPWAALTAGEYWKSRNINQCADSNDFICATRRINGGTNGLATRQMYLGRARAALHGSPIGAGGNRAAVQGAAPADFPMWAIGAIVGGVVVLVAAAIIVALVVRHRAAAAGGDGHEQLLDTSQQQEFSAMTRSGSMPQLRKK